MKIIKSNIYICLLGFSNSSINVLIYFSFDIDTMDLYIYFICGNYGLLLCRNELKEESEGRICSK